MIDLSPAEEAMLRAFACDWDTVSAMEKLFAGRDEWKAKAERAEALLREADDVYMHEPDCAFHTRSVCDCPVGAWRAKVRDLLGVQK